MLPIVLFVATIAQPSPAPSAAPSSSLKEIAHVRSTSACAELATHANAAIGTALTDDVMLAQMISALRNAKLDGNTIEHRNGLQALGEYARRLNEQALAGDGEIKRLRILAETSNNPDRKKNLKAFADWLGGAIWRQRKIARDLNGFLATMDFRDMATLDESQQDMNVAVLGSRDPRPPFPGEVAPITEIPSDRTALRIDPAALARDRQPSEQQLADNAAADFDLRLPAIANDEGMAADRIQGATAGC